MLVLTFLALTSILVIGIVMFIECKVIDDLPENNSFKKWWRSNVVGNYPENL
jgi:hypothetical protein